MINSIRLPWIFRNNKDDGLSQAQLTIKKSLQVRLQIPTQKMQKQYLVTTVQLSSRKASRIRQKLRRKEKNGGIAMMEKKLYLNKNTGHYSQWVIVTRERNREESHAIRDGQGRWGRQERDRVKEKDVF